MREGKIIQGFKDANERIDNVTEYAKLLNARFNKIIIVQNVFIKIMMICPGVRQFFQYLIKREEKLQRKLIKERLIEQLKRRADAEKKKETEERKKKEEQLKAKQDK